MARREEIAQSRLDIRLLEEVMPVDGSAAVRLLMSMNAELHDVHIQLARVNMKPAGILNLCEERLFLL